MQQHVWEQEYKAKQITTALLKGEVNALRQEKVLRPNYPVGEIGGEPKKFTRPINLVTPTAPIKPAYRKLTWNDYALILYPVGASMAVFGIYELSHYLSQFF